MTTKTKTDETPETIPDEMARTERDGTPETIPDETQKDMHKEVELDLSIWISNLEDLQAELIDAVDQGKAKSIPRIEREILELKDKVKRGVNTLSGINGEQDYKVILREARDILSNITSKNKETEKPVKSDKKKSSLSKAKINSLKKLKSSKPPVKKAKPSAKNIFSIASDEDMPLSERLSVLQQMLKDISDLVGELIEDNSYSKSIWKNSRKTWFPKLQSSLGFTQDSHANLTDTIEEIRLYEIEEREEEHKE